jgi:hypothetical protein
MVTTATKGRNDRSGSVPTPVTLIEREPRKVITPGSAATTHGSTLRANMSSLGIDLPVGSLRVNLSSERSGPPPE